MLTQHDVAFVRAALKALPAIPTFAYLRSLDPDSVALEEVESPNDTINVGVYSIREYWDVELRPTIRGTREFVRTFYEVGAETPVLGRNRDEPDDIEFECLSARETSLTDALKVILHAECEGMILRVLAAAEA